MNKDALTKGLAALRAAAEANNPAARQAELFQKSQDGTITSEERAELAKSIAGGETVDDVLEPFTGNDKLQKSIDVSDFLRENTEALTKSLSVLSDNIAKSEANEQSFRIALAGAVQAQGEMLKSMADAIETLAGQPARAPKSKGAQPMNKSFAGQTPAEDGLSRRDILSTMGSMLEKGMTHTEAGEDILQAAAKYEASSQITKSMYGAVENFRKSA